MSEHRGADQDACGSAYQGIQETVADRSCDCSRAITQSGKSDPKNQTSHD